MNSKHMDRYLEEPGWQFNNRKNPYIFIDTLRHIVNTPHMTYRRRVDGYDEAA